MAEMADIPDRQLLGKMIALSAEGQPASDAGQCARDGQGPYCEQGGVVGIYEDVPSILNLMVRHRRSPS